MALKTGSSSNGSLTVLLKYSLNISEINLSPSMVLFPIKVILLIDATCSERIGLIFFQKFLLSQTIDGF